MDLEPRALGQTDYPTQLQLREVYTIARHCSGDVILGFSQIRAVKGVVKEGTNKEVKIKKPIISPTPWNNLEAGILYSLGHPLMIFKENDMSGGIFDHGVTDVFVHNMPIGKISDKAKKSLNAVFLNGKRKLEVNTMK